MTRTVRIGAIQRRTLEVAYQACCPELSLTGVTLILDPSTPGFGAVEAHALRTWCVIMKLDPELVARVEVGDSAVEITETTP